MNGIILGSTFILAVIYACIIIFDRLIPAANMFPDFNKRCSWCNNRKIKYINGDSKPLDRRWSHQRTDGGRDRRYKNNIYISTDKYYSIYECNKCSAQTSFEHVPTATDGFVGLFKPSEKRYVLKSYLTKDGQGKRNGQNFYALENNPDLLMDTIVASKAAVGSKEHNWYLEIKGRLRKKRIRFLVILIPILILNLIDIISLWS
jgi:hypothetical protein